MPTHTKRITDGEAQRLAPPISGYALFWCPKTPGFAVRVTAKGARAWILERFVGGKNVRRTLGHASGKSAISADAARKLMLDVSSELQQGTDRMAVQRAARVAAKAAKEVDALTLGAALRDYVERKRRGKDGLPLKQRTKADYIAMIEGGRTTKNGSPRVDGELYALADKPLAKITADEIRAVFKTASARGTRRGVYAMQVLRAVMNGQGVRIEGSPFDKATASLERVFLTKTTGKPHPIPPECLGAWWRAATEASGTECGRIHDAADLYRLMLLTGARGGEIKGIVVRDVNLEGARVTLRDTKNRTDHVLQLSRQAVDIVSKHAKGKKSSDPLFTVSDPRKTLNAINASAGVQISAHDLRATFASVAEELVSSYSLKRMLNHTDSGDVTGAHYIGKSEAQLRAAWQAVADFIESAAP